MDDVVLDRLVVGRDVALGAIVEVQLADLQRVAPDRVMRRTPFERVNVLTPRQALVTPTSCYKFFQILHHSITPFLAHNSARR